MRDSNNFQKLFEHKDMLLQTGCWTRELVQMRAMRGSMLLPILFLFQREISGHHINHGHDVLFGRIATGLSSVAAKNQKGCAKCCLLKSVSTLGKYLI